jgi:hypothetical protein
MTMRRRPPLRLRIHAGAAALEARGLTPCAMDILPSGTSSQRGARQNATPEQRPQRLGGRCVLMCPSSRDIVKPFIPGATDTSPIRITTKKSLNLPREVFENGMIQMDEV